MNKTSVISIVLAIVVLGGIIWIARPNPQNEFTASSSLNSNGILAAEETSFDFGTISMAKSIVKHQFKIKNLSAEAVTISKMYTSCMCTTAALVMNGKRFGPYGMPGHGFIPKINEKMDAGEEATVEVVFDPAAHGPAGVGRVERSVTLENNAGKPVLLTFAAMVTP